MAYPEIYPILNYNQKVIFSIAMIAIVILIQIIVKIKNKTKKSNKKQITSKKIKYPLTFDCEEFVKINFKKQEYLFENKNRLSELIRLLNY